MAIASIAANWSALADGLDDAVTAVVDWVDTQVQGLEGAQVAEIRENLGDLVGTVTSVMVGGATRGARQIYLGDDDLARRSTNT